MREIKFRAWDKKYSKIEPDVIKNLPWTGRTFEDVVKDDRYILMQYTGLKDKNGKEIYEGDIVHYCSEDIDVLSEIGFDESLLAYAMYSWEGNYIFGYEPSSVFEVIGNIYENPELIENLKR